MRVATEPLLITAEEAARLLNVGRTTVYALVRDGELVPVKLGNVRRTLFRRRDVLALIGEEE